MTEKRDPRTGNHQVHIEWLLNAVKELQRDRETDRTEIRRLERRIYERESE